MRYERVKITRDTNTVHNRAVGPWEIPVLEFIFEEGNVVRLGVFEEVAGEYPEAAKELDRLVRCYGVDPANGVPWANQVFGNQRAGIRSVQKLIDEAKADDKAAAPPAARRGRPKAAVLDALAS